jgi:bifunctional enzyme CysN/CysC
MIELENHFATALAETPDLTLERMPIVVTGHVDHGKSTIVGRLLAETGSLPIGKLDAIRASCARNARPFEYAFLLDALKDEQAQGITIDSARVFFKTPRRHYVIIDAPGHTEFLKNMVTGASRATAALLVIDANEGIQDNSRRHGYLLSMLGIRQIAVLVNKMDLVGYEQAVFDRIVAEYGAFLAQIGVQPSAYIPVSGFHGDNLASRSPKLSWHSGRTVLEALDDFAGEGPALDHPFRMPVQAVYKFTEDDDDRRIVAGTVESGRMPAGGQIIFYPSGKKSRVRSIEAFNSAEPREASAGQATGFTLDEQVYVTRGELAARAGEPPPLVSRRLRVSLFWLGRAPLVPRKEYLLKLGTARVPMRVEQIHRLIDATDLATVEGAECVDRHGVAECTLVLGRPLAFDLAESNPATSRFVVVDDYEISGGGIIRAALEDSHSRVRDQVFQRNLKWAEGGVGADERAERLAQRATLLLITGERQADRKRLARSLEAQLFHEGRYVYFLAIGNILYGVDADLDRTDESRPEHVRRLGEVANILLDAGLIVIATAISLTQGELETVQTAVGRDRVSAVWVGGPAATDMAADLVVDSAETEHETLGRLKRLLQDTGAIFKPW